MVQPKYNAKESLERILLMMKYDSSKTLSENRNEFILTEDPVDWNSTMTSPPVGGSSTPTSAVNTTTSVAGAAGTGAAAKAVKNRVAKGTAARAAGGAARTAAGGAARAAGSGAARTAAGGAARAAAGGAARTAAGGVAGMVPAVASALGVSTTAAVGILAAPVAIGLAWWLITKDNSAGKVKKLFDYCTTKKNEYSKIPRKMSDATLVQLADKVEDAVNYTWGTDEDAISEAFNTISTNGSASDFCAFVNLYNQNSTSGDLYDDLDSDIDSDSDWNLVYRPIRNIIQSTLTNDIPVTPDNPQNPNQPRTGSCQSYTPVSSGPYKLCTASPVIKQVQGCLNNLGAKLVPDGKFGDKTRMAFDNFSPQFVDGFNDSDVAKICGNSPKPQPGNDNGGEIDIIDLGQDNDWGAATQDTTDSYDNTVQLQ